MAEFRRRAFLSALGAGAGLLALGPRPSRAAEGGPDKRLNVLFITADDMNGDTLGVTGCKTPDITPNLDRLAGEGLRFAHAHVTVAVCQPSRECLMTGRYPHRNGATGFYPVRKDVPTLQEHLKAAGYLLGILAKVPHLKPDEKFPWDFKIDASELGVGRDPRKYYASTKAFFQKAKDEKKPFFLMANSQDPHRPWAGSEAENGRKGKGAGKKKEAAQAEEAPGDEKYPSPNRIYKPDEVVVPGFLPDLPNVRREVAQYYSSAHRCDETVGEVLRALKESGLEGNTLVMFLSDNGISMPFAKSNCYLNSTRTPWIVRWPGVVKAGVVDQAHFVSGIDYMPTILEAVGVALPDGMDGRSFLPLLKGEKQDGRDRVFTCYNDTSARKPFPMRCLRTAEWGYIYNGWSDGKTTYRAESMNGLTFKAMEAAAPGDPAVAARVETLLHRTPEEFYDVKADPDALKNLIHDPARADQIKQARAEMLAWMKRTQDPQEEGFRKYVEGK